LSYLGSGLALLYFNFYFRSLGLDDRAIGSLNAAPGLGLALAAIPTFAVADRFPRKYLLLAGGAVTLLGALGVIASSELGMLIVFAAVVGAGEVITTAAGAALLAESTQVGTRARSFGIWFAASSLAGFVSYVTGGALAAPVAAALGAPPEDVRVFRTLLLLAAAIGASSVVPVLLLSSRERPRHLETPRQWGVLGRFALVNALFGFGAGSFLPFLNLFFAERFGASIALTGALIGAISVGGALGGLLHTRLQGDLRSIRGLVAVWAASLPFAVIGAFAPVAYLAAAALLVRGVLMTAAVPTMDAFTISSLNPRERSGGQAVVSATWALAYGAGAFASGHLRAVLGDSGFTANILTLVAAYAVAIVCFARFFGGRAASGGEDSPLDSAA
jgi:predicted MFS family arabinose efflux permease